MNRHSNRKATALAALSAAAMLAASAQHSSAQTWNNPTTGNWSVGANWVGGLSPASLITTQLTFNAIGAQTYTATNNIANPFLLNAMTFNNSGSGAINIAGSQLSFGGASPAITQSGSGAANVSNPIDIQSTGGNTDVLTVGGTGAGVLTLSGAFSSTPASSGTGGGALRQTNANGNLVLSGGGNLYSIRSSAGSITLNAGSWNLSSTQRHNDYITGNNTGFWSLDIGDTAGASTRFTMNGGTLTGAGMFLGTGGGSTNSIATFSNGANVSTGTAGRFGVSEGTGTINVLSGAQITSRLVDIGRQGDPDFPPVNGVGGALTIDGANSRVTSAQLVMPRNTGTGTLNITNGGKWVGQAFDTIAGNTFLASRVGGSAVANVTGAGSEITIPGTFITSGGAANATTGDQYSGGTSTFNLSNGGAVRAQSFNFGQNNAGVTNFVADGASSVVTTVGVAAGTGGFSTSGNLGKISDPSPGPASLVNLTFQNGIQATFAGSGVAGVAFTGQTANSGGGVTSIAVQSGALLSMGGAFLLTANDDCVGTLTVNAGSVSVGGEMDFGSSLNTRATVSITNGGRISTLNSATAGFTSTDVGSTTSITVNNGTLAYAGTLVSSGGGQGPLGDQLEAGNTTISLSNGARLSAQSMNLGQNAAGFTDITVDGPTTVMTSVGVGAGTGSWVTSNNLGFVGNASKVRLTVQNGATASLAGNLWGSGGITGSGNGISTFAVQSGGKLNVGGFVILSDPAGSQSHMTVTGANSQLSVGTSLLVGGNGTITGGVASVTVTDGGVANVVALTNVYPTSTVTIGTGTLKGSLVGNTSGVFVDGTINFNAGTFNTTGTLGIGGSVLLSSANRNPAGTPSNKKLVVAGRLDMTNTGVLDLNDNDALFHNGTGVVALIKNARNGNLWNQPGVTSTAAKNSVPKNKNLGAISGADYHTAQGAGATFDGVAVLNTDLVVKFTFNGDTDLNGVVNFDDYARIDGGFNNGRTGWFNGDFDYSGAVDFDDYSLIDQAFNTQGTVVLSAAGGLAGPGARDIVRIGSREMAGMYTANGNLAYAASSAYDTVDAVQIGGGGGGNLQAVPEPATIGLAGVALLGALSRRRRSVR